MPIIRSANEEDLLQMQNVFYQNEIREVQALPPPSSDVSLTLLHILQTGNLYVAEQDNQILAYAGTITRDTITFLTDLFVHPEIQSTGLGKMLLQRAMPPDGLIHCTMSSSDPRAQALYIRAGMQPQFPNFNLHWGDSSHKKLPNSSLEVVEAESITPELTQWDRQASGRERPLDHTFWVGPEQGRPLWFLRQGTPIGYGYVRLNVGTLLHSKICKVGPIGVKSADDATDCVLAAINWASKRAKLLHIDVPGHHPSLAPLLDCGFRILYADIFLSSATIPFFDTHRYIPSGSDLL